MSRAITFLITLLPKEILAILPRKRVVRPPGAIVEEVFLELCSRCGACITACSKEGTGALEPCSLTDGLVLYRTPKINPLKAPCEAVEGRCKGVLPCVRSCPTGALQFIDISEIKLGTVIWNSKNCIAVKKGGGCLVCIEVCPIKGAIIAKNHIPHFNPRLCVGCGSCVVACPASPKALTLTPIGERRVEYIIHG